MFIAPWIIWAMLAVTVASAVGAYYSLKKSQKLNKPEPNQNNGTIADEGVSFSDNANGDFTIPFSISYTSGQKVTVSAEKDGAEKSIELYAPSDVTGGGVIKFSGNMANFPQNIGEITLASEISGEIAHYAMTAVPQTYNIFRYASGLILEGNITTIGVNAFEDWRSSKVLIFKGNGPTSINGYAFSQWNSLQEINLNEGLTWIGNNAFQYCSSCKTINLPSTLTSIGQAVFVFATACETITCLATTPPSASDYFLNGLNGACVIKVPAVSLSAYQTAANWSAYASKMIGV